MTESSEVPVYTRDDGTGGGGSGTFRLLIEEKPGETVMRHLVDTRDTALNDAYRQQTIDLGVEPYVIIYEGEVYNGVRPHTFGADGWPVVDVPALKAMLEGKYGITPNSPETKWVMIDYETVWLSALSTGDPFSAGSGDVDTELMGPRNRRATQEITNLFNDLKSHFGPNVKFTLYGCPRMYNFATIPVPIDSVEWALATEANKQQRIANTVIQHKDVLKVLDWFSGSTYDGTPSAASLVENGGTVLQRANTTPYGRDITGLFDQESQQDEDRWVASMLAIVQIARENGDLGSKQILPIMRTRFYTRGVHFRSEQPGPRDLQFIPNEELVNRVVYGKTEILAKEGVQIDGVCFWDAPDFVSRNTALTTNTPADPTYQDTLRGSIVRNYFGGIDPVASGQYVNWGDVGLANDYGIRHNDSVIGLIQQLVNATIDATARSTPLVLGEVDPGFASSLTGQSSLLTNEPDEG